MTDDANEAKWWERTGEFVNYPELRQDQDPACVYTALAGAVNHLMRRGVWTRQSLQAEYQKDGARQPTFAVARTAVAPVAGDLEIEHHFDETARGRLEPARVREWLSKGAVVIVSMELADDSGTRLGNWHMFSLVAAVDGRFQVWDTNGFRGFLTESELLFGFSYPDGRRFLPHRHEDTLVVMKRKADAEATADSG